MQLDEIKKLLIDSGVEVYRVFGDEIQIAERIRVHIMDSGIRVRCSGRDMATIEFAVRAQRSDFPNAAEEELYALARAKAADALSAQGFAESGTRVQSIESPVDPSKTLDTWYEVCFSKEVAFADVPEEVRGALEIEKYVSKS